MHEDTLYPNTKTTIELIKDVPILQDFYLAGGTALALQLGHRKSIDLDFFIRKFPRHDQLFTAFKNFTYQTTQQAPGTLDLSLHDTKVSFLEYDYDLLDQLTPYHHLQLASIRDIACMKLSAITGRGVKKDYVDLYFIFKQFSLADILDFMRRKFTHVNYSQTLLLRALNYFADADTSPMPDMLIPVSWEEVKAEIQAKVLSYTREQLG